MSDALEFIRNSSMAGEEVAGMVDTLLERIKELERERDEILSAALDLLEFIDHIGETKDKGVAADRKIIMKAITSD